MKSALISSKLSSQTQRKLTYLLIIGIIFGVGCSTIFRAGFDKKIRTDLSIYRAAGAAVLDGADIYSVENERTWYFTSPPIVAILCTPLAFFPLVWDAVLIYVISILLLYGIARLSFRILEQCPSVQNRRKIMGICFLICSIFFSDVLTRGQFGILLLFALMLALYGWLFDKPVLTGLAVGFAISIKITPAALIPLFFLMKKSFRAFVWSIAGTVVFTVFIPAAVFGIGKTVDYLVTWAANVPLDAYRIPVTMDHRLDGFYADSHRHWRQIHDPFINRNQSLYAVFVRLIEQSRESIVNHGVAISKKWASGVSYFMLLVSLGVLCKKREGAGQRMLEFSLLIIVLLVSSTLAWTHYFSTSYVAFFSALSAVYSGHIGKYEGKILKGTVALSAAMILLGYAVKPLQFAGFILWGTVLLWAGTVGALAFPVQNSETA